MYTVHSTVYHPCQAYYRLLSWYINGKKATNPKVDVATGIKISSTYTIDPSDVRLLTPRPFIPLALTGTLTHTLTLTLTHTQTHTLTHTLTHVQTHTQAHTLTHTLTHILTHTITHTQTHTLAHAQAHTQTDALTHTIIHSITHALTHTLIPYPNPYPSPYPNPNPNPYPNPNHSSQLYPLKLFLYSLEFGGGVKSRSITSKSNFLPPLFNTGNQGVKSRGVKSRKIDPSSNFFNGVLSAVCNYTSKYTLTPGLKTRQLLNPGKNYLYINLYSIYNKNN